MRIVTWNCCRGTLAKKAPLLDALGADIAVLQECAKPPLESDSCLWFGDNPRQGIAVLAKEPYRLQRVEPRKGVPRYIVPVSVSGPVSFTLLAVWSKGGQTYSYVEAVIKATRMYRHLIAASPTLLIGDLNSNVFWDSEHKPKWSHSGLVAQLATMDLVSAYHEFHSESHGRETRPTYFFLWKEDRPYHLDYCFLPREWMKRVCRVEIGSYDEWKSHSDHRPLLVETADGPFAPSGAKPATGRTEELHMAEIVHEFSSPIQGYAVRACTEQRGNVWVGWLEYVGSGSTKKTGEETSQPTRDAVAYWASGLEPVYLEGALGRATGQ